jgi:ribonuclease R
MPSRPETPVRRETLVAELRRAGDRPLSLPELMQRARVHPGARQAAKKVAREMVREGLLVQVGRRFALPRTEGEPARREGQRREGGPGHEREVPAGGSTRARSGAPGEGRQPSGVSMVGLYTRHRDGFGFMARLDRRGADLFVAPGDGGRALDGDLVRYEVIAGRRGPQARVVEVLQRGRRMVLGVLDAGDGTVAPLDRELPPAVAVGETPRLASGDVVKVWLDQAPGRLAGRVVERVRDAAAPSTEVLRVAYAKGFADVFPDEVLAQADAIPDRVRPQDREGRRDLTRVRLVTIDGEDARDFDDAVHVERLSGRRGWRLVVAIADVSHYVRAGGALDAEAMRRGTSVYFPGAVLPMLPERLSNGICSLNPEVERLCVVADLRVGPQGEAAGAEIYPAVMRSAARCTYDEVARMLDGDRVPHREFLRADVEQMAELQVVLTAMRRRRGAMDFDLPESKILLGAGGEVLAIERRPRNRAHRIVEEFMLAANEAVARWFGERELPTIYRVHGLPDEEKLRIFLDLARAQGFEVPEVDVGPLALSALLDRLEGHPQQRALNQLLLRAMMQAVYSPENIGHYGLGAEHYLHFTSPIRRYPDLMVHRLLREAGRWGGGREPRVPRPDELERIALLASQRERAAMEGERDVHAFYAALFMRDHVGERSRGTVAAVTDFGLFVSLHRWFVEGLVRAEDLGEGFALDAEGHALVEARSGRAYRVGDEIEVEVAAADPVLRRIDLALVEAGQVRARADRERGARADRGRPRQGRARGEGPGAPGRRSGGAEGERAAGGRPRAGDPRRKGRGGRGGRRARR